MDVFLMVHRHKTTVFIDSKESSTVLELKLMIEGILQRLPEEQCLYKDDQLLDEDNMTLLECGFTGKTASLWDRATVGLALWVDGTFEDLHMEPYSNPEEAEGAEQRPSHHHTVTPSHGHTVTLTVETRPVT
ncbi:PREDICTED: transcription elongation factor B polypeptide 2-like [Elephantulus edwardii]|uniref:transcription elongation factor B polypeptide 2-like n=1 Tax=Elephantulus edwardii TaxID=28737 RepID=UPI0003F0B87F|nr:PREDICTED: transcription elongation factor B polypeptide 2-like [Elephantulus edwardii]